MKKCIARVYAAICMLVMLVMMVPAMTYAAEADQTRVAISVKVPEDWQDPCVWAWNEDGTNAFDAWPGEACEATPDNDGWYYVWVPARANHVIVNANEGTVQTGELVLDGKDAWITVSDADNAEVSYDALTTGEIPAYVEKFTIHAKVDESWQNPCLWAWSAPDGTNAFDTWPGKEMKADDNGWYSVKAPIWVNSIIVNANEGSVQTEDLSIDPAEIWVSVEADGTADFSYKDPDKAEIPNVTVHVIAPDDWAAPSLWAWSAPDGTNAFAAWPGEAFTEEGAWLVKEIPGWVNSIIVNGNDGSVQTSDISIETEKDVWVVVSSAEEYEVYYEEPEVTADDATADSEPADIETTDTENAVTDTESADTQADDAAETATENTQTNNMVLPIVIVVIVVVIVAGVVVASKKKTK